MKKISRNPVRGAKPHLPSPEILVGLITTLFASQVLGASANWNIAGSGTWSNASAWSTGVVAGSGDSVTFNTAGLNADESIYLNGNRTIASGTFTNSGVSILLGGVSDAAAANTLTLSGSLVIAGGAGSVVIGDTSSGASAAVNLAFATTNAQLVNSGAGTLTIANALYLSNVSGLASTGLTLSGTANTTILGKIYDSTISSGTAALMITNTGTTTLAADNSGWKGGVTLNGVGATSQLIIKNANALGSGTLFLKGAATAQVETAVLALDADTSFANTLGVGGNAAVGRVVGDRATAGAGLTYTFSAFTIGGNPGIAQFQSGSNVTSGTAHFVLGATVVGDANATRKVYVLADSATVSLASVQAVAHTTTSNTTSLVLGGMASGTVGAITDTVNGSYTDALAILKMGTGTWTMTGANAYSGATTLYGGTLRLDYDSSNSNKLSDTAALVLGSGTLELSGGSYTESVGSTSITPSTSGLVFVKQVGGSSKLALGAITYNTNGALDFSASNIATTSNTNTNGILNYRTTVAGSDFATVDSGSNIVAYAGYTPWVNNNTLSLSTVYKLAGSGTTSSAGTTFTYALKIETTGDGQSLVISSGKSLFANSILFTGSNDYTISTSGGGSIGTGGNVTVLNYAQNNAVLSLGAIYGTGLNVAGTGKTVLTTAATGDLSVAVMGCALQFSNNFQLGTNASIKTITLNNGTLIADTTNGAIALNNGGNNSRNLAIATGGGVIDVIGGNSLTISGTISSVNTDSYYSPSLTLGSKDSNGTIILSGSNNYIGGTILAGGIVQAAVAETPGTSGAFGKYVSNALLNSISFTGGTLQFSSANSYDYSNRFSQAANQSFKIDTNSQNVTFATGLAGANNTLDKYGQGTLTLAGDSTFGGATTVHDGKLDVNGSIAGGDVIVNNNATLGGSGSVGGVTKVHGGNINGSGLKLQSATFTGASTLAGTTTASSIGVTSGTTTVTGVATVSGATTVSGGATLKVNGTLGGTASIVATGTLGGTGTVTGATTVQGTLAPGNSIGILNTGSLTLGSTSTLDVELGRSGGVATSDLTNVTGAVDIVSGANLKLTLYTGTALQENDFIFLISNDGADAIQGAFTSLNGVATSLDEGSLFAWNSQTWSITYKADYTTTSFTGGNDVALMVVPEPATWAMILSGLGSLVGIQRMRRRY